MFSKNYCVDVFVRLLNCCCLLFLEFCGRMVVFCPLVFKEPLPDLPATFAFPFIVVAFVALVCIFCGGWVLFFTELVPEPPLAQFDDCRWFLIFFNIFTYLSWTKSINF